MNSETAICESFPREQFNGEDCIIIPISQIISVELNNYIDPYRVPEIVLTVIGRR